MSKEVKTMYKFYMMIGDWSNDGHGHYKRFIISSNVPVEYVRKTHYKIKKATGIDIESICSEYEDNKVDKNTVDILEGMGFQFGNVYETGNKTISVPEMAQLWIFLLQKTNPILKLNIIDDNIPMLQFYGFDENGRHIKQVGYGLFL